MKKDSRIKLFKNKVNSGAAVTRNVSLEHAKGDFIAFLDSDDLWYSDKLEKQVSFMGDQINFSFTAYELIDAENVKVGKTVDTKQKGSFNYQNQLRKKATMGCSTVMLRRSAFNDIKMPLIRTRQDYALWLKLLKTGESAVILNEILTQYRILPDSISRNKIKAAQKTWFVYREIEKLSFFSACISFIFYAWRGVFKTQ
ncbi:group 2 family glycosyl transferase [Psychromonas sp. CNPT3]|nr:group 2 family glycosyl transferase [Psychromonas sp. CNPT3]